MANASDIITYIGVPLAVLGVLPILYTFILSILTQRRIRSLLIHHGHRPVSHSRPNDGFNLRSSPMTSMVEVELPRYTIAPLDRNAEEYWTCTDEGYEKHGSNEEQHLLERGDRAESTLSAIQEGRVRGFLRGGSWRAFHWKKLIVGRKLYRIQYEDELREPPAEVGFEELVVFLLDWGAVPDGMGWEKLRSGGLWTPSGTVLLRRVEEEESEGSGKENSRRRRKENDWVLRTSMPDEGDGVLSLTMRWSRDDSTRSVSDLRGASSLPPGWGRLKQPGLLTGNEKQHRDEKRGEQDKDLPARVEELKSAHKHSIDSTSFRFHSQDNRIQRLQWETNNIETGFVCEPFRYYEQSTAGLWFTCATSAVLSQKQSSSGGLWAYEVPNEIKSFVRKDSIPCGVLVMLGILAENDAPQWSSEKGNVNEGQETSRRMMRQLQEKMAAQRLEATMPPEQAKQAAANRRTRELQEFHEESIQRNDARQEREERMIKDAIASPRMGVRKVAEACLVWLIEKGQIRREWTVEQLAESVLYLIVVDLQSQQGHEGSKGEDSEAMRIVKIIEEWMSWTAVGGMKKQQYHMLEAEKDKIAFCFAVSLVAIVAETLNSSNVGMGRVGADMLECLRLWRKVRLG